DLAEHGRERALAARDVAVEAADPRSREQRAELVVDALSARADRDPFAAAGAADPLELALRAAVMAAQCARARVGRDPRVAARALQRVLALGAEQRRSEPAPIQEQQPLVAGREVLADRRDQRRRQSLPARVLLEVDDSQARHAGRADSPRHLELAVAA